MITRILNLLGRLSAPDDTSGAPGWVAQIARVMLIFVGCALATFVYGIFAAIPTYLVLEFFDAPRGLPARAFALVLVCAALLGVLRGLWHCSRYLRGDL